MSCSSLVELKLSVTVAVASEVSERTACNVNPLKLLNAHKSHVRETSLFIGLQSAIAKLLVSCRCQVKIWEGQAEETAWG